MKPERPPSAGNARAKPSRCASRVSRQSTEASPRQGRFLASHPSWSGWVDCILVLRGRCSGSRYTCCLINTLGLTELVSDALGSRKQKEAETNAKIVDLLKHALDETKNSRNEQQRVEFHIALACVMPARETQGTNTGWITRICERLGLKRGKRSQKNGGRPYASDQRVLTTQVLRCQCSSTRASCAPRTSPSRK